MALLFDEEDPNPFDSAEPGVLEQEEEEEERDEAPGMVAPLADDDHDNEGVPEAFEEADEEAETRPTGMLDETDFVDAGLTQFTGEAAVAAVLDENSPIRKWQVEHNKEMAEREAQSLAKLAERKEQARAELDGFVAERVGKMDQAKKTNREQERAFIEHRDAETGGNEWERVAEHCDLQKQEARGKDVSRIRQVLLQLKASPVVVKY